MYLNILNLYMHKNITTEKYRNMYKHKQKYKDLNILMWRPHQAAPSTANPPTLGGRNPPT
jgi:hypothetical protein